MKDFGLLRLPLVIFMVLQATRWKLVQGVDYKVTLFVGPGQSAGTTAEVFGQLTGTLDTTASTSFGSTWFKGSSTSHIITNSRPIGQIKSVVIQKRQTGFGGDDGLQLTKVTVESTAMSSVATFQCPNICNIRFPNLLTRLHSSVDGNWSDWTVDCSCKSSNDAVESRTCSNPAPYFGGKDCVGEKSRIITNGCFKSVCKPPTTIPITTVTNTATPVTTDDDNSRTTTTPAPTENALFLYGIPILATLVIIGIILVIALCVYFCCFAKKEKEEKPKHNQVVPNLERLEEGGSKPQSSMSGRPFVVEPIKHKPEGSGAPKQYTLPVFGPGAEKRELFGEDPTQDDSGDSRTSLLREESRTSTPVKAASLPSLQGQEENLYSEVAAPRDEVSTVGGIPVIVGATKWTTRTSAPSSPQKVIHREIVPHTISLPGNQIIRAGSVIESEDISEVTNKKCVILG